MAKAAISERLAHLRELVRHLPLTPGVYRMLDERGDVLYVGKAKALKNRVGSYFSGSHDSPKTRALVALIQNFEITETASETEALLLEQTLIKALKPPYNILLRDDKSYPYVLLSDVDGWARLGFHRGPKKTKGRYFGPFPNSQAVRDSLQLLQKLFLVRQCEDSFFRNRSRPCLQHQIKRCKAPCVGLVSAEEYQRDVENTRLFLEGRNEEVTQNLIGRMEAAAQSLAFEEAAQLRDQLAALKRVQEQQFMVHQAGSADVFAVATQHRAVCVQVLQVRDGHVLGGKAWYPDMHGDTRSEDILAEFIPSYYLQEMGKQALPKEVITTVPLADANVLAEAVNQQLGHRLEFKHQVREARAAWQQMAQRNAELALQSRINHRGYIAQRYADLQQHLGLDEPIQRMECFDISHTQGEATVASCVVFGPEGPLSRDYRRFNIEGITGGDDYAAMHQALSRRYQRIAQGEEMPPDILFIDGGKGQLAQAQDVLTELGISGVLLIGIAKGEGRKPGLETLHFVDREPVHLKADAPGLHLIQHIRDEAHRFAITGHRARRAKARKTSTLEGIAGIGPAKRRALIAHFGGLQEVQRASARDLATVPGISDALAETLYAALHSH